MSKGKLLLGTIIGAVAGFATGILSASKPGKETIADLNSKANGIKQVVTKKAESSYAGAVDVVEDIKDKTQDVADDIKTEVVDLKNRTERAIDGAKTGFFGKK